jgi:hypothetical protein
MQALKPAKSKAFDRRERKENLAKFAKKNRNEGEG